jgi:drug/metabolite transporter (DMT)-like permease
VLFAAVSVVWGMPYLFIKIAVDEGLSPAFLSFARVALAAVVLLPLAWRSGALRGLRAKVVPLLAFALAEVVVPFPLIAFGEQHVASSLTAIIVAALPLTIALLAIRFDHEERVTGSRLIGLFVGLGGVIVLFGIDIAGSTDELVGALCILGATVGYAIGPMVLKRHLATSTEPVGAMAVAMLFASIMLLPAALLSAPSEVPTGDAIAALVVLGLVCTALAFLLWFMLIADVGPSRASVITYINPVVAVALGVTLLDESLSASAVAGLLLILAGSWLSTGGGRPQARRSSRRPDAAAVTPASTRRVSPFARRADRAAFAPQAPCTPPLGYADADAR